jgi:hypothetical protein
VLSPEGDALCDTGSIPFSFPREEDVEAFRLANLPINEKKTASSVLYANGSTVLSSSSCTIGPAFPSLIVPGQRESLISPVAALKAGGVLTLHQSGGSLTNASGTSSIPIFVRNDEWRMKLKHCFDYSPEPLQRDPSDSDSLPSYLAVNNHIKGIPTLVDPAILCTYNLPELHQRLAARAQENSLRAALLSKVHTPASHFQSHHFIIRILSFKCY